MISGMSLIFGSFAVRRVWVFSNLIPGADVVFFFFVCSLRVRGATFGGVLLSWATPSLLGASFVIGGVVLGSFLALRSPVC